MKPRSPAAPGSPPRPPRPRCVGQDQRGTAGWRSRAGRHRLASNHLNVARTAASPTPTIAPCTRGSSDTAYNTLRDFGALNVRSNPGTRRGCGRISVPFGANPPVAGAIPASTARRSSPSTSPTRPRRSAPTPAHTPGAVVVVQRLRHPGQLVRLLANPELRDAEHHPRRPKPTPRLAPPPTPRTSATW